MATRYTVSTVFKMLDQVSGPLNRMTGSVNGFANSAERRIARVNSVLNGTKDTIGAGVKVAAGAAVTGAAAMGRVVGVGAEFEQQITNAAVRMGVVVGATSKDYLALSAAARETGRTTEFSASQAAMSLTRLGAAGFSAAQSIGALPTIMDLATAAQLDLEAASTITLDTLGQFGLKSKDPIKQAEMMATAIDKLTKASNLANLEIPQVSEALKQAGAVAHAAGASLGTTNALIVALAEGGKRGGEAGTTLRAMFTRLQAPVGEAATVLRRLGVRTRDARGDMLDIVDVLGTLGKSMDGMGTSQRAAVLKTVFGEEAIAGASVLLAAGTDKLNEYRRAVDASAGVTKSFADVLRNTSQADMKNASSAIEGLTLTFFELNRDGIRSTLQGFTDWVRTVDTALGTNKELAASVRDDATAGLIGAAKAVGVLIGAMVALKVATMAATAVSLLFKAGAVAMTAVTWAWNAAMWAMPAVLGVVRGAMIAFNIVLAANPIGAVITALGVFATSAYLIYDNWGGVKDFFVGLWSGVSDAFSSSIDFISAAVQPFYDVVDSVTSIWDKLRGVVSEPIKAVVDVGGVDRTKTAMGQNTPAQPTPQRRLTPTAPGDIPRINTGEDVSSPQEALIETIRMQQSSSSEITLRNETNARAEVTRQRGAQNLKILDSGGF